MIQKNKNITGKNFMKVAQPGKIAGLMDGNYYFIHRVVPGSRFIIEF
jgi:hypothetical protein